LRERASEVIDYNTSDFIEAVRSGTLMALDAVPTTAGGDTALFKQFRDRGRLVWISSEDPAGPPPERDIQRTMFCARADTKSLDAITRLIGKGKHKPLLRMYCRTG